MQDPRHGRHRGRHSQGAVRKPCDPGQMEGRFAGQDDPYPPLARSCQGKHGIESSSKWGKKGARPFPLTEGSCSECPVGPVHPSPGISGFRAGAEEQQPLPCARRSLRKQAEISRTGAQSIPDSATPRLGFGARSAHSRNARNASLGEQVLARHRLDVPAVIGLDHPRIAVGQGVRVVASVYAHDEKL